MADITNERQCAVAVYLYGDDIRLGEVSNLLGLSPTRSGKKGDVRITASGSEFTRKIGFWEFRKIVNAVDIGLEVGGILRSIKAEERIIGCAGITRAELDIFKPLDFSDSSPGISFDLSPEILLRLAQLGLELAITAR